MGVEKQGELVLAVPWLLVRLLVRLLMLICALLRLAAPFNRAAAARLSGTLFGGVQAPQLCSSAPVFSLSLTALNGNVQRWRSNVLGQMG